MKLFVVVFLSSMTLRADIHTDIQNLLTEGNVLSLELTNFSMNQEGSCMNLGILNQSIEDYTSTVLTVTANMGEFSVTDADLDAMNGLSFLSRDMSAESVRLSLEMSTITDTAELFEYSAGMNAILELSQDIGKMANRILEMSDRILIMADNIDLMADRIIATQVTQSQNVAVTQSSILVTQQNMVLLSDSLSTIAYNLSLGQIIDDENLLVTAMDGVNLESENLGVELATVQTQIAALLDRTSTLLETVVSNSAQMSHYINADTLTMLGDLSTLHAALAVSLEAYANTINQIAPLTDTIILSDATATMLQLTKEIGVMSDRIMEMSNDIYIMADNIGLMADKIVLTQEVQMNNVALTESSLLASQTIMITVIKNFGL